MEYVTYTIRRYNALGSCYKSVMSELIRFITHSLLSPTRSIGKEQTLTPATRTPTNTYNSISTLNIFKAYFSAVAAAFFSHFFGFYRLQRKHAFRRKVFDYGHLLFGKAHFLLAHAWLCTDIEANSLHASLRFIKQ